MTTRSVQTELPAVRSDVLDDLIRDSHILGEHYAPDVWAYLREQGLQEFVIDPDGTGMAIPAAGSSNEVSSLEINGGPTIALAVFGIWLQAWVDVEAAILGAAGGLQTNYSYEVQVTYNQPVPPASSGTPASLTGNLAFRNKASRLVGAGVTVQQPSTTQALIAWNPDKTLGRWKWFRRPVLWLGSQLTVNVHGIGSSAGVAYEGASVLGKYVAINEAQYVNLVALATGEAILPPTILG